MVIPFSYFMASGSQEMADHRQWIWCDLALYELLNIFQIPYVSVGLVVAFALEGVDVVIQGRWNNLWQIIHRCFKQF